MIEAEQSEWLIMNVNMNLVLSKLSSFLVYMYIERM
jgi:hypothetical protein